MKQLSHSTLSTVLRQTWIHAALADRLALADEKIVLSYSELARRVDVLGASLAQAGVRPADRIAILGERGVDQAVLILAALAAGACVCPFEPRLPAREFARRVKAVGINGVIHDDQTAVEARNGALPVSRCWHVQDLQAHAGRAQVASILNQSARAHDPALLLFTSGSTGTPKGVLLSQGNLLANAQGVADHTLLTDQDVLLHVMPFYHSNGLNNQLFAPLLAGAQVVIGPRFRAEDMPALMARYRPTVLTGVPTMYGRMLDQSFTPEALARLRFLRCGSAPITEAQHRAIEVHFGCEVIVSYGLSEATCTSVMNPPGCRRIGTIGTVLPNQSVTLRSADGRILQAPGSEGEICISGPTVMLGYVGVQAPGQLDLVPEGLIRTGDLGRFDEAGFLRLTGRIKEVIIRGGENISPTRIEEIIANDPGVRGVCVVGRPDSDLGEVPVACVVPHTNTRLDKDALADLVEESLGKLYRPADVVWMESLPENAVGKVDRNAVAERMLASFFDS